MTTREHTNGRRRAVGLLAVLSIGLAACGSSDDEAGTATEPAATEPAATEPAATEPAATQPAASVASTEPPATEPSATEPPATEPPTTVAASTELTLPTARSEIVPTAGDLPNGVYRFTQTVADLLASDPGGSYSPSDEFIGEFVLKDGTSEIHYFNMDSTPMAGEPPDTGGTYQVQGDLMVFATPPERAMPGTNGIVLLRWSLDGDTLTLEQIDDGKVDADFIVPWTRVGDAP